MRTSLSKAKPRIKVIGFDADDTLWLNEVHYRQTEQQFVVLMEPWLTEREASKELFRSEMESLMVGNSLRSDVIPVLEIGSEAIHIPYHTTWAHEHVSDASNIQPYMTLDRFHDLLEVFYQQT